MFPISKHHKDAKKKLFQKKIFLVKNWFFSKGVPLQKMPISRIFHKIHKSEPFFARSEFRILGIVNFMLEIDDLISLDS